VIRGAIATVTVGGTITALILTGHHPHPKRHGTASAPASVTPLNRASRSEARPSLPVAHHAPKPKRHRQRPRLQAVETLYADTTMYCATGNRNAAGRWPQLGDVAVLDRSIPFGTRVNIAGNVYRVEDWIGSGSRFDIFGGDDEGCEQRALNYGRRHLRVVVDR